MKPLGKCPFCGECVRAKVIEENFIRRDYCECSKCNSSIYVCRYPGCDHYAKGGDMYDDELCPYHTRFVTTGGLGAGKYPECKGENQK